MEEEHRTNGAVIGSGLMIRHSAPFHHHRAAFCNGRKEIATKKQPGDKSRKNASTEEEGQKTKTIIETLEQNRLRAPGTTTLSFCRGYCQHHQVDDPRWRRADWGRRSLYSRRERIHRIQSIRPVHQRPFTTAHHRQWRCSRRQHYQPPRQNRLGT